MRKTKFKSNAPIYEKRWSQNKSGRGIHVADIVEELDNHGENSKIVWEVTYPEKLTFLLSKHPGNSFYRSLDESVQLNMSLSEKQCRIIENAYWLAKKI